MEPHVRCPGPAPGLVGRHNLTSRRIGSWTNGVWTIRRLFPKVSAAPTTPPKAIWTSAQLPVASTSPQLRAFQRPPRVRRRDGAAHAARRRGRDGYGLGSGTGPMEAGGLLLIRADAIQWPAVVWNQRSSPWPVIASGMGGPWWVQALKASTMPLSTTSGL